MADKALKTSVFIWEGTDKKGSKVKGELTGQNPMLVKAQLRKQGINPLKVRKKGITLFGAGKKIKPMDIALFTRQMATMMGAGRAPIAVLRHHWRGLRKSEHAKAG